MVDLDILVHNSMLNMWKSNNEKIEDKLEELRVEKEIMKSSNRKFVGSIRFALGSTYSSQFDMNAKENKKILLKLQQERQFR